MSKLGTQLMLPGLKVEIKSPHPLCDAYLTVDKKGRARYHLRLKKARSAFSPENRRTELPAAKDFTK